MAQGKVRINNAENDLKVFEVVQYGEPVVNPRTGEKHRKIVKRKTYEIGAACDAEVEVKPGEEPPTPPFMIISADEHKTLLEESSTYKAWIQKGALLVGAA